MCLFKTPSYPKPKEIPPPQESKAPDVNGDVDKARRDARANAGMAGSTLLTGPSGIENSQLNLGRSSALAA